MKRFQRSWVPLFIFGFIIYPASTQVQAIVIEDEAIRSHFPTAFATDISQLCYDDSQLYLKAYFNKEKLAFKMYKTTGLLYLESLKNNLEVFTTSPGLFDECLSIEAPSFTGQYCSAFFQTEEETDSMKQRDGDDITFKYPRVGFCLPSSCTSTDFRSSVSQLVTLKSNQTSSIVTITDDNYCFTKKKIDSAPKFDGPDIIVLMILSLLGLLVVSATIYDIWRWYYNTQNIDTKWKKFLHCFSPLENGNKVLSTKVSSSDLSCLHGIRFFSATWVILYHTYLYIEHVPVHNEYGPDRKENLDWDMQGFMRGCLAVDTFFLMGGLLVTYSLLKELKRDNGSFNVFSFYVHRYIRITPFYALYAGFIATLVFHMGSGPLWHFVSQKKEACRLNWWKHFLYIDNYFTLSNPPTECMIQSWYLASDMQLFVFSPLFIYPLWKWSKAGLAWITFSILTIIGALAAIFTLWNLPATSIYLERPKDTWNSLTPYRNYFFQTWARLPQYLIGVLLGWLIFKSRNRRISLISQVLGWVLSSASIVIGVYGMVPFFDEDLVPVVNPVYRVAYGTLHHLAWGLAVGWIIFACINGYGGLINTFLSWKGFMPLGRLSFIAFLVHYDFIKVFYTGFSRTPFYYTKLNLTMGFLGFVTVSYMLSFILSVSIETPFINLDRNFIMNGEQAIRAPADEHEKNSNTTDEGNKKKEEEVGVVNEIASKVDDTNCAA